MFLFISVGPICSVSLSFLCLNYSETLACIASHLAFDGYDYVIYISSHLCPFSLVIGDDIKELNI